MELNLAALKAKDLPVKVRVVKAEEFKLSGQPSKKIGIFVDGKLEYVIHSSAVPLKELRLNFSKDATIDVKEVAEETQPEIVP